MAGLLVAGFVLAHGLVHASYLMPPPAAKAEAPAWPFRLDQSWLLRPFGADGEVAHALGVGLVLVVMAGFGIAALAVLGIAPTSLWRIGVALGSAASLVVLILFFHPWLVLGIAIDVVLLWAVVLSGWLPEGLRA